jgi:hypothetical protein
VTEFPDTRESLLVQVRSAANREAWDEFVLVYRPVIYRLARNRGMQDADAQDLAQRVPYGPSVGLVCDTTSRRSKAACVFDNLVKRTSNATMRSAIDASLPVAKPTFSIEMQASLLSATQTTGDWIAPG